MTATKTKPRDLETERADIDRQIAERDSAPAILARRQQLAADLAGCSLPDDGEIPPLTARVADTKAAFEAAQKAFNVANSRRGALAVTFNDRRRGIEAQLLATAPPEITAALNQLEADIASALRSQKSYTEQTTNTEHNNRAGIERYTAAARAACSELVGLRLQALDATATTKALAKILKSVPNLSAALEMKRTTHQ